MTLEFADLRQAVIRVARGMEHAGLNRGTAGNVSVRVPAPGSDGFLITPSGTPCERLTAQAVVAMTLDGEWQGALQPSSEWRFHRDIYRTQASAGAVVHAHSPFATALACIGAEIPAFHYMIARFGGSTVRCAAYATFGSEALSHNALLALQGRCACLLANHGMLVYGRDLEHALALAIELETLCEHYWRALQVGKPTLLGDDEMAVVLERFKTYGQPKPV